MEKVNQIESYIEWLTNAAQYELKGCQITAIDGTVLYTPDGLRNYRALWTRDFAYMVGNAWDLIPVGDIKNCITLLMAGQRHDGCIPDRVQTDLRPVYSAGPSEHPLGAPPTDNSQFMVNLVYTYVSRTKDVDFARSALPFLIKALDFITRSDLGLVFIPNDCHQSPYGFTDTIAKTGNLLFSSLLYWQACKEMAVLCEMCDVDASEYHRRADIISQNSGVLWNPDCGAYLAATDQCAQVDIWGNAYAITCGFLNDDHLSEQRTAVLAFLRNRFNDYVSRGQVRHLLKGTTWQKTLTPIVRGRYQNGAYWATASGWVMTAIAQVDPGLAKTMFMDLINDFQSVGIYECINGKYAKLNHYVVSAVNPLGAARDLFL